MNDWIFPIDDDFVIQIPFSGRGIQVKSYNHFITNYRHSYDWAAFFDCDEFLVLKKH
jgi:hypothetical protein